MEQVIIIFASLGAVVVGSLVLLAVMFALTRRRPPVPHASAHAGLDEEPSGSVIISSDYEEQARPERIDMTPVTPVRIEDPSDSFAEFVPQAAPPRTYSSPLPMPVPPPDLEPIPEHEPTQLFARRPDWATDY